MDEPTINEAIVLHQHEAEKMFAGAVMIDEQFALETCGWLAPEMIRDAKIREFWKRVKSGVGAHEAALQINTYYEFCGYLNRVVTSTDLSAYANQISTDSYLFDSFVTLSEMARAISERNPENLRMLAQSIAERAPVSGDVIPNAVDIGLEFQVMLDDVTGRSELTGIAALDKATGGLENSTLTILAARPSMGKSALGIQIAKWRAEHLTDKKVMLFSLEMNRLSIWARMACGELRLAWRDVRSGSATPEQLEALKETSARLMDRLENRLLIDDTSNMATDDIWRKISRYRPSMVIIDHMGLVNCHAESEVLALGQISRNAKIIAKQFDIPVLALYQLNRGTESRDNKRPTMRDIRGSGKIEENADNILFLFREDYYDDASAEKQTESKSEIIIAKFRDGYRNICVNVDYDLQEQWFYSKGDPRDPTSGRRKAPAIPPIKHYDHGDDDE